MSNPLYQPLQLPCGVWLKNRIIKSAMSDSLGDGCGDPTDTQIRLYERWAEGGLAAAIIGEVQGDPQAAEKPGNLVLSARSDQARLRALAACGAANKAQLWLQLGHAGAMAHPPISQPKGPSAINVPGLTCTAMDPDEIDALPAAFAQTAAMGKDLGFGGVQIHAAHGFLLSQFLSPLFNKRTDRFGGVITKRMELIVRVIAAVREAVGPGFPIAIKINATDQLDGGLEAADALTLVAALDGTSIDLIDISGGTYFPGATAASDSKSEGPYFATFAQQARKVTGKPLMLTGGFKTRAQAIDVIESGTADFIGLARALVIDSDLPNKWAKDDTPLNFPRFATRPEGGVTAWYTLQLTQLGNDSADQPNLDLDDALAKYNARDAMRAEKWIAHFGQEG